MKRRRSCFVLIIGLFSAVTSLPLHAEDEKTQWLIDRYQQTIKDKIKLQAAYNAGQERIAFCSYCHGEDGNSLKPDIPNLAGQNPIYLWKQIEHFATGKRKNFVMESLAKKFSDEEKLDIAIYFAANKVKPTLEQAPELVAQGKQLYFSSCVSCHGKTGEGDRNIARVAGQKMEYLKMTLKNFWRNANDPAVAAESTRRSQVMESMVGKYSDEQFSALAAFISSMQ